MTVNLIWSIVLSAVGILGIYLAGSKNIWGWVVGFGAQALWFIFAIVTKQYGFILSAVAYGWVYGRNYIRWRRESALKKMRTPIGKINGVEVREDGLWATGTYSHGQVKATGAVSPKLTPVELIPKPRKSKDR